MHELDRGRALAHRGRHALHAPRPDVADREHPGQAGLELVGPALERPLRRLQILGLEVHAGLDEALRVERHAAAEPPGVRVGAGHGEDVPDVAGLADLTLWGLGAPPPDALQPHVALEGLDLRVGPERDGRALLDTPDEVARHAVGEPGAPHQQVHVLRDAGQEHRGLPGRVASAHHRDVLTVAELRLHARGAVVHAVALEPAELGHGELAVGRAGGHHDRVAQHRPAVRARDPKLPLRAGQAHGHPGHRQVRAELLGLEEGAARQVLAGDAHGEPEVVLDAGARTRLAAGGAGLQHQHVEPFRGRVDRCGQTGGPRAHDDDVVHVRVVELRIEAERSRDLRVARIAQRPVTVLADQDRDLVEADLEAPE